MRRASRYEMFIEDFRKIKKNSRLFMFILFDNRPTHKPIGAFVEEYFLWLDDLAESADMYGFSFIDDGSSRNKNPSLRVATHFGIKPNQLPGVIFFTMWPEKKSVKNGVYLPIKVELFSQNIKIVEGLFASIFTACQDAQAKTSDDEKLIKELRKEISAIKKRQQAQPIYNYLGERIITLVKLPDRILETVADAFGENLAKRIVP